MALLPHSTGTYRAYKKINGKEYQFYFTDLNEAERKQAELDSLAKLNPKPSFRKSGHIVGFRLRKDRRPGRGAISMKIQKKDFHKEYKYNGNFNEFWKRTIELWKEINGVTKEDVAGYRKELREAKRVYMKEIGLLEAE